LQQHVVDELHGKARTKIAHVKDIGTHGAEHGFTGGEGLFRPTANHRKRAGFSALGAAGNRCIEQHDALG